MNTLECIKTRHSTRKFKADQLSRKLIDQVLDAGRPLHRVVIRN